MADQEILKFRLLIQAPAQQIYAAFTRANALSQWLCNGADVDAHEGGRMYLWWQGGYYSSGEYLRLTPGVKLAFTWHGRNEPGTTIVKVTLEPQEDGGTLLKLNHTDIGEGKIWRAASREYQKGWLSSLENLRSVLETGQDLRLVRRPMLGVSGLEDMTPALAESLGVPFVSGLRLDGTVEGYGAHAAGLQKDDILTKLAGEKTASYGDLVKVLQGLKAGDEVKVNFQRAGEKQTTQVTLSARPMPELPATQSGLLAALKAEYSKDEKALAAALKGATPVETAFQPAADAWNVKKVLCHMIVVERAVHEWLTGMIEGRDPNPLLFHSNLSARIQVMVDAYGSATNLLKEFKRSSAETLGLLAAMPAEITENKGDFWLLSLNLIGMPDHTRAHIRQIQELLAQARQPVSEPSVEPDVPAEPAPAAGQAVEPAKPEEEQAK